MTPKQRTVTSGQRRSGAAGAPASAWQASDRQGAVTTLPNTHSVSPNAAAHRLHVTRFPFYRRGATQRQTQEEAQAPPGAPGSRPGASAATGRGQSTGEAEGPGAVSAAISGPGRDEPATG